MNIKASLIFVLILLSCSNKSKIVLTEGGNKTENLKDGDSPEPRRMTSYESYEGFTPDLTKDEIVQTLGEPYQIEIIRGRDFYLYCRQNNNNNFHLAIVFEDDLVHEFEKNRSRKSEYPDCEDFHAVLIKDTNTRLSGHDLFQELVENKEVVVANFEAGSADPMLILNSEQINELVTMINNSHEDYYIMGHTNNQGNQESNLGLSIQRASATINLLVEEYGLKANMLVADGEGEMSPRFDNNTPEGRRKNSRVVLGFHY